MSYPHDLSTPRGRLMNVYRDHPNPTARELVDAVVRACKFRGEDGPLDDEVLDALALLPAARREIDAAELRLLDRARENGTTWDRIGRALGYGASGEGYAQAAQRRATMLRARIAGRPVDDDQGDESALVVEPAPPVEPGEVVPC